jgi:hypothetical protein
MPQRTYSFTRLIARLVLLSLAAVALAVLRPAKQVGARVQERRRRRSGVRRVAVSLSFAALFFAGASFSAGAGDLVVGLVEQQGTEQTAASPDAECTQANATEVQAVDVQPAQDMPACADGQPAEPGMFDDTAPADDSTAADDSAATGDQSASDTVAPDAEVTAPSDGSQAASASTADLVEHAAAAEAAAQNASSGKGAGSAPSLGNAVRGQAAKAHPRRSMPKDRGAPVVKPSTRMHTLGKKLDPEARDPNTAATIWLHRAMPDPTPPSKRLTRRFAHNLVYASHQHHVDWALMLGVLRARGHRGSAPASKAGLDRLAGNLVRNGARRHQWSAVLALEGRTAFADRTIALARYHRAVGVKALVRGLEWAKPMLTKRTLRDKRITMYSGGRNDLVAGRIDVRVIVMIRYLAEAHGQITVSCLESGHRLFARPGVVSAHIYGLAVDIAALGGVSIMGHQLPGSVTEEAVRNILLLPAEVRPVQVISLLGLGGPSFPLANHDDHIHVGF